MRFVIFTHSLVSDWNHGNAHFLRGIASELTLAGHVVRIYEPRDGWSRKNLLAEAGPEALEEFRHFYPLLQSTFFDEDSIDLNRELAGADVVLVHEWNSSSLVKRIGEHRARTSHFQLFFHDTHHRSVTDPASMEQYDLRQYDGVLVYGDVIRSIYLKQGWASNVLTWHEAADANVFYQRPATLQGDLVWIGNWGDNERTEELREFLIEPVKLLKLKARVYGVRYPEDAIEELRSAGIEYGGWLPNYRVPEVFARYRMTVHIPRRPYMQLLPGIPTIRPFEAMACGIPLISAPWQDAEHLFRPGTDFLFAANGDQMVSHLRNLLANPELGRNLAQNGLATIRGHHTCKHRVSELLMRVQHHKEPVLTGASR